MLAGVFSFIGWTVVVLIAIGVVIGYFVFRRNS